MRYNVKEVNKNFNIKIMKTRVYKFLVLAVAAGLITASCEKMTTAQEAEEILETGALMPVLEVKSDGTSTFNLTGVTPPFDSTADLSATEIEFIFAVREDEKVARDLYKAFFEKYQLKAFDNIARAEANHMRAAEMLFTYYEIDFPAAGDYGMFADSARQANYNKYLLQGATALDAFKVMAYLEEENIVYYGEVLSDISNPNIKLVIENLARASENHLRAAIRQITALGGTYQAMIMTEEQFKAIIAKGFEQGKRYRYMNNGQRTNSNNRLNGNGQRRGGVNKNGECTFTQGGNNNSGTDSGRGRQGKGYRGGRG
jgi:hypothetical protein